MNADRPNPIRRTWAWTTLGAITRPRGLRVQPTDMPDAPFVGLEHIEAHTCKLLGAGSAKEMRSSAVYFAPGDVLYGRLRPYLNKVYKPEFEGLASGEFIVFPAQPHVDGAYLQYFLNSWEFVSFATRLNTGDRPRVDFEQLADHLFPLAPLPEQRRIVAEIEKHLTRLDAAVAALKRAQANLKRYRASVLKAACEGRLAPTEAELARAEGRKYEHAAALLERIRTSPNPLRERRGLRTPLSARGEGPGVRSQQQQPPDTSSLPPLTEGWVWASLGQVADIQGGIQKQPSRAPKLNRFPFLRVANVMRGQLNLVEVHEIELFAGELEKLRLQAGDLLIIEGNGSPTEIGRMALWTGVIEDCVHQNHIIRARMLGSITPQFVEAYWNSPAGTERVFRVASSTSGLYTLSVGKVSNLPVPFPPHAEQQRIVAEVERRLSVVQAAETAVAANLKRAERLRQAILKRAFEGKLVPQDPSDEPASKLLERILAQRETSPNPLRARRGLLNSPLRVRRGAGGEV